MSGADADAVRRLLAAVTKRDTDASRRSCIREIEAHGRRGPFRGVDEVGRLGEARRRRLTSARVELDERAPGRRPHVAADARRQWRWKESGEVATEDRFGVLFEFRDGRIYRWRQDFGSIIDAIEAIPAERATEYAGRMAEAPSTEAVSARLAEIREGLTLLADYL